HPCLASKLGISCTLFHRRIRQPRLRLPQRFSQVPFRAPDATGICLTDTYRAARMRSRASNICGPWVLIVPNDSGCNYTQSIGFGASCGSPNSDRGRATTTWAPQSRRVPTLSGPALLTFTSLRTEVAPFHSRTSHQYFWRRLCLEIPGRSDRDNQDLSGHQPDVPLQELRCVCCSANIWQLLRRTLAA